MNKYPISPILTLLIFAVSAVVAFHSGTDASVAAFMVLAGVVINSISAFYGMQNSNQKVENVEKKVDASVEQVTAIEKKVDVNTAITTATAKNVVVVKRQTNGEMAKAVADAVADKIAEVTEVVANKVVADAVIANDKLVSTAEKVAEKLKVDVPESVCNTCDNYQSKPPEKK